jgi:hypothetical protein
MAEMQPERRVGPKVEGCVGGSIRHRSFPSILANAKNLRGFEGLVPQESPNVSDFQFSTFRNSSDQARLHFTLNQNSAKSTQRGGVLGWRISC